MIIGRNRPFSRPPRSPVLNEVDFFEDMEKIIKHLYDEAKFERAMIFTPKKLFLPKAI